MGAERFSTKTSDIPTTQRVVMREIQGVWLDRLLVAACEVNPTAPLDEALMPLPEAVGEALPAGALGVCVPTPRGQLVVRRSVREPSADARDPSRLFPEFRFERVVVLACDEGATLHVASDDDTLVEEGGPCELMMARLALVLGSAIRGVRERERARSQTLEVQAQVIQTEKLASLGQIAAGIVHELNNPLTSILAYSDYLRRKSERANGDASDLQRLVRISEAAERILRFSRDLDRVRAALGRGAGARSHPRRGHRPARSCSCEHVLDQTGVLGGAKLRQGARGARRRGAADAGVREPVHERGPSDARRRRLHHDHHRDDHGGRRVDHDHRRRRRHRRGPPSPASSSRSSRRRPTAPARDSA